MLNPEDKPSSEALLEVRNLTTRFDTEEGVVHAVNNVSYSLEEGETLGVVGESGCGKSVHALSIMRLIPVPPGRIESGEIYLTGNDLLKKSEETVRRISDPLVISATLTMNRLDLKSL